MPVKWNGEHGKLLEESLVLSDSEQVFAFCRALLNLQSYKLYFNSIMPTTIFLATYYAGQRINQHQNLYVRPFLVRTHFVLIYIKSFKTKTEIRLKFI